MVRRRIHRTEIRFGIAGPSQPVALFHRRRSGKPIVAMMRFQLAVENLLHLRPRHSFRDRVTTTIVCRNSGVSRTANATAKSRDARRSRLLAMRTSVTKNKKETDGRQDQETKPTRATLRIASPEAEQPVAAHFAKDSGQKLLDVGQSESERGGAAHVTVRAWYAPSNSEAANSINHPHNLAARFPENFFRHACRKTSLR
jgi:hypothetical protein